MANDEKTTPGDVLSGSLPEPTSTQPAREPITASCHCGRVTLEIPHAPKQTNECQCSICYRYGAIWCYYTRGDVTVTVSAEPPPGVSQQKYVRTDKDVTGDSGFYWCGHCGCMTHWWKLDDDAEAEMGVNGRMFTKRLDKQS
ncbi:hypothetical protein BX600DRAFT_515142 [Xylariales sp. PMI_506]|nr:hypothetical protein BX600DRAFT_515142 [Xylariales sp. PMI_506]